MVILFARRPLPLQHCIEGGLHRGSEAVHQYPRILSYGRVDEYVGDSEAGLPYVEPLLDGALPEISVDHIIGGHPLTGIDRILDGEGCSSPRPPPNGVP